MTMPPNIRVVIVSYYFPPLGLAGTARPLALANFYAERGHAVTVVSVKPISYPAYDRSLESLLDAHVKVIRVGSSDPARLQHFLPVVSIKKILGRSAKSAAASKFFPDSKIGFVRPAINELKKILSGSGQTILITTSPPVSSHLVGLEFADLANLTWVADFRDIWSSLPFAHDDPERVERAEGLQKKIIQRAVLVTATSPLTASTLATRYDAADKTLFLPNGYDESDFADKVAMSPGTTGLYGTLNELVGFDKIAPWLGACAASKDNPRFQINHVGYLDLPGLTALLAKSRLSDRFSSTGYLPHRSAVAAIRQSAVNLIALTDDADTLFIVPSKLWELLRAEPPLIAILPRDNAAREILEQKRFPGVWIVNSQKELDSALTEILAAPEKYRALRPRPLVQEFEWCRLFTVLSEKLTGVMR